jgi:hypothetical protein
VAARRKAFIREGRNPKLIPARQLAGRSTAGRFHMGHKIIQPRKASLSTEQNCQVFLPVVGAEHQTFQISLFFFFEFQKKNLFVFFSRNACVVNSHCGGLHWVVSFVAT